MKVEFLPSDVGAWLRPRAKPRRSAGLHVSTVVTGMLKQAAPKDFGHYGNNAPGREATWELGHLVEDMFDDILAQRTVDEAGYHILPKREIEVDGIYGAPDRLLEGRLIARAFAPHIVEETKGTWLSLVAGLDVDPELIRKTRKFAYWCLQLQTYVAMIDQLNRRAWHDVDWRNDPLPPPLGHLRAFFVNGTYKDKHAGKMARALCWRFTYEREELDRWWENVRTFADRHREELHEPGDPAAQSDRD